MTLCGLPRVVGQNDKGEEVLAANGRYGPYIKAGKETRSLNDLSPLKVTLKEALFLLSQPKQRGRKRAAAKPPLKVLRAANEAEEIPEVKILDGRFGPYVTDGTLNASVPRGPRWRK